MRFPSGMMCLAAVALIGACARSPEPSQEAPPDTSTSQVPDTSTHATVLVDVLPAGVEGVELVENGVRILKGYEYVQETDSTFAVRRKSDGQSVVNFSCGCRFGVGCVPIDAGGILVCAKLLCRPCGLMVKHNGVTTEIVRYDKQ